MDVVALIGALAALVTTAGNIVLFYQSGKQLETLIATVKEQSENSQKALALVSERFDHSQRQINELIDTVRAKRR